jgi:hypothetical protein
MSMKNFDDPIGNQTRDAPTCSVVHQPTTLPRAPLIIEDHFTTRNTYIKIIFEIGYHHKKMLKNKI